MPVISSLVRNTMSRFLSAGADKKTFKKIQNLLGFLGRESGEDLAELGPEDNSEEMEASVDAAWISPEESLKKYNTLKKIEEKNDHKARILEVVLRDTILEDYKQADVAEKYNKILNQFPKDLDFLIRKKYPGTIPEVKELIKEDYLTDLIDNSAKYLAAYKRSEGDEGKRHRKSERAIVRVKAPHGQDDVLEGLIKAGTFKAQIAKTRPSDLSAVTAPGTFKVPTNKDFEEKLNEEEVELTIQTGRTEVTLKNEQIETAGVSLIPGKVFTFNYKGRNKGRGGGGQGLFEVAEKAADISKIEGKYGTLSLEELKHFIQYTIEHYVQALKAKPQEITETEFSRLTKGLGGDKLTLDNILEESGSVADLAEDEDEVDTEGTPEKRKKKREEEQKGKEKRKDRQRRSLGLTEESWEKFAPSDKDKIDKEVDSIKTAIANEYDTVSDKDVLGSVKDLLYTRTFVKSFMDYLFDPSIDIGSKRGVKDWRELVKKNASDWVMDDPTLKKVYLNTMASKTESGSSMASEALAKIKANEGLNKLYEAAVGDLNKSQLKQEEEDRDVVRKEIEKIKEKNISREKDGIKPLPLPTVKKKLKQTHPLVEDVSGKKVNLSSLKKIIESDADLKKAVYSNDEIAKNLTPNLSEGKIDKDVFGSLASPYIVEFIKDLQEKILKLGPSEFPNLMKMLKRKENSKDDTYPETYRQELKQRVVGPRPDLKDEQKQKALDIPKRKASEYSFLIKNAFLHIKNQGK